MRISKAGSILVVLLIVVSLAFGPLWQIIAKATGNIHLKEIGRYDTTGAEISAYDPATKRLFVTGASANVEVLDLSDPTNPTLFKTLTFDATSVTIKNGIVAIAVPFPGDNTKNGSVYLYNSRLYPKLENWTQMNAENADLMGFSSAWICVYQRPAKILVITDNV